MVEETSLCHQFILHDPFIKSPSLGVGKRMGPEPEEAKGERVLRGGVQRREGTQDVPQDREVLDADHRMIGGW